MAEFIPVDPFNIVIFGGTGDLTQRKLLPALYHRYLDGQIDKSCKIIGVARSKLSRQDYCDMAKEACQKACDEADKDWSASKWKGFVSLLEYEAMDVLKSDADWKPLKKHLKNKSRACLEKPIGEDLKSAQEINQGVGAVFDENVIYRIDHYLGKETVQNLLVLRFANALFEPVWSRPRRLL